MKLENIVNSKKIIDKSELIRDPELLAEIQQKLAELGFYALSLDGIWGPKTESAIKSFCTQFHLNNFETGLYGATWAQKLKEASCNDISCEAVAKICGASLKNVQTHLPCIIQALREQGIYSKATLVAAIATIGTEVPNFAPINEIGGSAYFTRMYEGRKDLGNHTQGDGARYHGRGHIQLTGRHNYRLYGQKLGVDLEGQPELALQPDISAKVLALYFKTRGVANAANSHKWERVRRLVNGGTNGLDRFKQLVAALMPVAGKESGFTLIELLVVVAIIGILSAIALPSFLGQANKARESEAKQVLSSLLKAQQIHYLENGEFATKWGQLELGLKKQSTNYNYELWEHPTGVGATAYGKQPEIHSYLGAIAVSGSTFSTALCRADSPGSQALGQANLNTGKGELHCGNGVARVKQ